MIAVLTVSTSPRAPHRRKNFAVFFCGLFCLLPTAMQAAAAAESDARAAVERELNELSNWMRGEQLRAAWNNYLKHDLLQAELKAEKPNWRAVIVVYDRYRSGVPGLHMAPFVDVREALQAWLAELSVPPRERLPEVAAAAKDDFKPVQNDEVAELQDAVAIATDNLEKFLATGGDRIQQGWKEYLRWDQMQAELKKGADADFRKLNEIAAIYTKPVDGMGLPPFVAVRRALRQYIDTATFFDSPSSKNDYGQILDLLAEELREYAGDEDPETAARIGSRLGWLTRAGQAEYLVALVRYHYGQPNIVLRMSEEIAAAGVNRQVNRTARITDNILGTSIYGTGHTQADVTVDFTPNKRRSQINLLMAGTNWSRNVGYNGPATIYSRGTTSFTATKPLYMDARGISSGGARARATTRTTITGIGAHWLIRRIAWRRALQSQGRAQWIAARHAEQRIARQMNAGAADLLQKAQTRYQERFRKPLVDRGEFPREFDLSTDEEHLTAVGLKINDYQIAAHTGAPQFDDGSDFALRLHETFPANSSAALLAGETLTDERLVKFIKDLGIPVPDELKITPEKDPWSITFGRRPITATFRDGRLAIEIQGRRFTRGQDQKINASMRIKAEYKYEVLPDRVDLVRQGDVLVEYMKQRSLSVQQIAFKTFLRRKFEALFDERIQGQGLTLPGDWQKVGKLRISEINADDGWLSLGWRKPTDAERQADHRPPKPAAADVAEQPKLSGPTAF